LGGGLDEKISESLSTPQDSQQQQQQKIMDEAAPNATVYDSDRHELVIEGSSFFFRR
jgi:hypothetical protein